MKFILLILLFINPITYILDINRLQKEAEQTFRKKNYAMAINRYVALVSTYQLEDESILLNLAHCYFELKDADRASFYYLKILEKGNNYSQSIALNQLGYLAEIMQDSPKALEYFKKALLQNPSNEEARFNYELVKKRMNSKSLYQKSSQNANEANSFKEGAGEQQKIEIKEKNQNGKDKLSEKEEEVKEELFLQPEKLQDAKLNKEKAEALLNALQNQETQYLQQLPRRKKSKSSHTKNKNNW